MNYPDDVLNGANRNPEHPNSPFHISDAERIAWIAEEIINGDHSWSVEDVVVEIIYENKALLKRYKQGLQDIALGPNCGYSLHMVIDEAIDLAAKKIFEANK